MRCLRPTGYTISVSFTVPFIHPTATANRLLNIPLARGYDKDGPQGVLNLRSGAPHRAFSHSTSPAGVTKRAARYRGGGHLGSGC